MRIAVKTAFVGGFALVVGLFLLATVTTVVSVGRVRTFDAQLTALDDAKHQGHMTLADVQQQYIHQVHTIIGGDRSHLDHYLKARRGVAQRLDRLVTSCAAIGVQEGVEEIRQVVDEMHLYFTDQVLPNFGEGPTRVDPGHYDHLDRILGRARHLVISLNSLLEDRSKMARRELERVLFRTQVATLGTLSLAALAAVVVGLYLTRAIVRPLARLHSAFESVGAGELDTRVDARGPRELSELAAGFNEMAAALAEMRESVAQNERMAVMGELAAGVAHELNNPLGVIKGYLKIVRKAPLDAQVEGDLAIIAEEVRRCQETVRGLTELARPHRLPVDRSDLGTLVEDIVERMEATREELGARVRLTLPEAPIVLAVDQLAMGRVITNLLKNAIDAAGSDGTVDITVEAQGEGAAISVADSGDGIDPDIRDDIFKPFRTGKSSGMGLGLSISQAIVESHGGRIEVGESPLGGAQFRVLLPGHSALAAPEDARS